MGYVQWIFGPERLFWLAGGMTLHDQTWKMAYLKSAIMPALIRPEIGTVTNQAKKIFLNRRQSTAFLERSHPTDTTEPT